MSATEVISNVPSLSGLVVPIVGQYYRGAWAKVMLEETGLGSRVFLKAEPSNKYDKNAYKVLIWKFDKFNHVGYVQRHSASKIASIVRGPGNPDVRNNNNVYIVGQLSNSAGRSDTYEVKIVGVTTTPEKLTGQSKKDIAVFGKDQSQTYKNLDTSGNYCKGPTNDWSKSQWISKSYLRDHYTYYRCVEGLELLDTDECEDDINDWCEEDIDD